LFDATQQLDYGPNPWHVHDWPVTGEDCSADSVSGHYNPPGHPNEGELAEHFGNLENPVSSSTATVSYDTLTLLGPDSIVGRSIVIHKDGGDRWACATIGESRQATASFVEGHLSAGPVRGGVTFTQVGDFMDSVSPRHANGRNIYNGESPRPDWWTALSMNSLETTFSNAAFAVMPPCVVDIDLDNLEHGPLPWHVHEYPVTGDDCGANSVAGHYNPAGTNEQGEMSNHHGDLVGTRIVEQKIDTDIYLFGRGGIVGRSIVLHKNTGERWACATIGNPTVVAAEFSFANPGSGDVRGTVTFTGVQHGPTVIDVALSGLEYADGDAGRFGWHVHEWPVTDGCGGESTGGHFNPTAHPTAGELSQVLEDLRVANIPQQGIMQQWVNEDVVLHGVDSIVGRSIVIHKGDGSRHVCATIGKLKTAVATFDEDSEASGDVRGTISFSEVENGPTVVEVDLANVEHGPNPWHVHEYGGDGESCGSDETGGHFNPAGHPLQGELGWLLGIESFLPNSSSQCMLCF
jgi:Cu/Zn superoxide dismutase